MPLLKPPSHSDGSTVREEPEPQIQQGTRGTKPGALPVPGTADGRESPAQHPGAALNAKGGTRNVFTGTQWLSPTQPLEVSISSALPGENKPNLVLSGSAGA